jgi:ABC-type sugar transport system ATPase subunit
VRVGDETITLAAPLPDATAPLELGIRPEHIALCEPPGLALAVTAVEDHGRFQIVTGQLAGHRVKVRLTDHPAVPAVGATVHVRFPAEHVCVYRDHYLIPEASR